ncbi:hypothetical protein [Streptomyces sp. 7N604]|uniref:hypothetical protein n=1 Tax=Streptomyces sp. 7N604 TaxID=3457415 RepID=UPI003FD36F5A
MSDSQNPGTNEPTGAGSDRDNGYSATELGDHWVHRPDSPDADPDPEDLAALHESTTPTALLGRTPEAAPQSATVRLDATVPQAGTARLDPTLVGGPPASSPPADAAPQGEGMVLRFGPGVTGSALARNSTTAVDIWHGTLAGQPHGPGQSGKRRRGGLRRYTLAGAILIAVIGFLLWQRLGPGLAVESVAVRTGPKGPACDDTADVIGVVRTNGAPGTIEYRWVRSDGTISGTLRERLTQGQREARLHLLWTFRGRGSHEARAELRITSPGAHTASTRFTYNCR